MRSFFGICEVERPDFGFGIQSAGNLLPGPNLQTTIWQMRPFRPLWSLSHGMHFLNFFFLGGEIFIGVDLDPVDKMAPQGVELASGT